MKNKETISMNNHTPSLLDKLEIEYNDTFGKYTRLSDFLFRTMVDVDTQHWEYLKEQLHILHDYCMVLGKRINWLKKGGEQ